MSKTIRWGIIGIGRFGSIHARSIRDMTGSELVAIANRNPERLSTAKEEFAVDNAYVNFRDLLADPNVDIVSITTHWKDHYEVAMAALDSGKHVFLEKPMASSSAECRELAKRAESANGFLMIGHICRFDPRVTLAKQAIESGRIGKIVSMHARRNLPKAPGSIRLDKVSPLIGDGIHDADLMLWFMNRNPTEIYGRNVRVDGFTYPDLGWAWSRQSGVFRRTPRPQSMRSLRSSEPRERFRSMPPTPVFPFSMKKAPKCRTRFTGPTSTADRLERCPPSLDTSPTAFAKKESRR